MSAERTYLSAEQLAELTPWSVEALQKMVKRGMLKLGVHYFRPFGRRSRLIFKWEAMIALIEGIPPRDAPGVLVDSDDLGDPIEGGRK